MDQVKIYAGGGQAHLLVNELVERTCRLCIRKLDEETRHWALFEADLPQKLMAFAAVQIQENDGLPAVICSNCHSLIYMAFNFKCQVEKSDHDLRQALLLKQSTDWSPVPNIKSIENITAIEVMTPCLQKSIMNSCMEIHNEHNPNPHEQFIFEIANSIDSQTCKPDELSSTSSSILSGNIIHNSNSISFEMNSTVPEDKSNSQDAIAEFEAEYKMKSELEEKNQKEKLDPINFKENSNPSEEEKPIMLRTKRHKCNYCIKSFANLALLEKHAMVHKNIETVYICHLCNKQFSTVDKVKSHAMTAHGMHVEREKIMENSKMKRITGWVKKIGEDNTQHSNSIENDINKQVAVFTCKNCCRQFSNQKSLTAHQKTHSDQNINKVLNELNKSPSTGNEGNTSSVETDSQPYDTETNSILTNLENNFQPTFEETNNEDKTGEESYISQDDSMDESESEEEEEDDDDEQGENDDMLSENIQCNQCGKLVATLRNLKRHLLTHSGLKHNCSICGKDFSRPDKLREHQQLKHKEELFGKSDSDNESSDDNKKKDKNNRPFKCSLCPKAFAQPQSLANHEERHKRTRDVQKRYLCEVCSKCFAQSGSLVAHMRTHTGVKPYVCNVCNRAFTKSTYLQLHLRTHSGEKPYICQYCSRAFARANTLARHITMHTGEAKYHCQVCTKSFRRLTSLNEHTYTHTGQRPYACKICSKRYNNAGSLYAHAKKCKAMQATSANSNLDPLSIHIGENNVPPPSDNNPPQPLLIFTDKNMDEVITDEGIATEPPTCQFMITNVPAQKPMPTSNLLETFMIQEPDIYNMNAKQFKMPYYGLYPSM